jgi:hypothetical protein
MPQTIVAVKPASSASGASGVTRYIAESKRDPQKEHLKDGEARPLFSTHLDDLDYHQANKIIGQPFDSKAQADEVLHLVISLEPDQFEALGGDLEERKNTFKEVVRNAADAIQKEANTSQLNWVSGIHLNTDNPHAHVAISRYALDAETEEVKILKHLPRTLLPHHELDAQGALTLKQGVIAETVASSIEKEIERRRAAKSHTETPVHQPPDLAHQPTPPVNHSHPTDSHESKANLPRQTERREATLNAKPAPSKPNDAHPRSETSQEPDELPSIAPKQQQDRELLGRAMVVAGEVERLERELNSLIEHGDKRRFRVYDASHDRTRQISQLDVHRRAEARAGAAVRDLEITDPNERHHVRARRYKAEVAVHDKALHDHNIIVQKTIQKTNKQLSQARLEHAALQAQVRAIVREYGKHRQLPTPLLPRDELSKLQNQAINNGNPARIKTLERIRQSLAVEHNAETRTDKEIARLEGQLLLARAEQAARVVRLQQFEQTKHQTSWQIGSDKYSLVYVDRQIEEKENASKLFRLPLNLATLNFFPSSRRAAAAAAAELKESRTTILSMIDDRRNTLTASLKESVRMTETLSSIFTQERDNQQSRMGERMEKELTRSEISRLVDHSTALGDPAMLRQALLLESQYNTRQSQPASVVEQSSKATGRDLLGHIAYKAATERLDAFQERKDFVPVVVQDLDGKDVTTRLFDFREPLHPLISLVQRLSESKSERHLRNETNRAINFLEEQLQQDVRNLEECRQILTADAARLRESVLKSGHDIPDATFTTKQIMQLEIHAHRQPDPNERDRLLTVINQAEASRHVFTPQKFDNEKIVDEVLAKPEPGFQDTQRSLKNEPGASTSPQQTTHTHPDPLRNDSVSQPWPEEHDIDLLH